MAKGLGLALHTEDSQISNKRIRRCSKAGGSRDSGMRIQEPTAVMKKPHAAKDWGEVEAPECPALPVGVVNPEIR